MPDRILDLLEIAAYVFAADRWVSRGRKDAVEFHAWMRSIRFIIRVRDSNFWNRPEVKRKLSDVLIFMTGDKEYTFDFVPGHSTATTSLFDSEEFEIVPRSQASQASVVLFSGGIDSLSGVLERLHSTQEDIYLISHSSGQPTTKRTRRQLVKELEKLYPGRIHHYSFECGLTGHKRAAEETQRTRAFLFASIAYALAHRLSQPYFFIYENGITSLNLSRRQDLINSRASRTTHPKTLALMSLFLSEVEGAPVKVHNPFWQHTKTDVFELLNQMGGRNLLGSTVSCSRTFQRIEPATHCGCCFQCIDRRLAAYASGLQEVDNCGIYSKNILIDQIESPETRTTALDYIRQATTFANITDDRFYHERLYELSDIVDFIEVNGEQDAIEKIWKLCNRHGKQVVEAIKVIRQQHDDPCRKLNLGSLLQLIADREHLKDDARKLAERITAILATSIPIAFKTRQPAKEDELNDHIDALLRADGIDFHREFPSTTFALAKVIPDHEARNVDLLTEAKYVRRGTSPSKATEGIAADITKYQASKFILFVIYDPERGISDDATFKKDIEGKRDCLVTVIR
ncbi:MAG: 7-cyano-7-deazaguanine synthase [Syntrophales bacterium]|nr:7-cyano-7-deazaguanine synthase [Syntrophales bacterium]